MILLDYVNAHNMVKRIASGVFPIEIQLYNLALGGDALVSTESSYPCLQLVTPQSIERCVQGLVC